MKPCLMFSSVYGICACLCLLFMENVFRNHCTPCKDIYEMSVPNAQPFLQRNTSEFSYEYSMQVLDIASFKYEVNFV